MTGRIVGQRICFIACFFRSIVRSVILGRSPAARLLFVDHAMTYGSITRSSTEPLNQRLIHSSVGHPVGHRVGHLVDHAVGASIIITLIWLGPIG